MLCMGIAYFLGIDLTVSKRVHLSIKHAILV